MVNNFRKGWVGASMVVAHAVLSIYKPIMSKNMMGSVGERVMRRERAKNCAWFIPVQVSWWSTKAVDILAIIFEHGGNDEGGGGAEGAVVCK